MWSRRRDACDAQRAAPMCQLASLLRFVRPKIDEAEAAHLPDHEIWVSGFVFDARCTIVAARSLVGRDSLDGAYGAPHPVAPRAVYSELAEGGCAIEPHALCLGWRRCAPRRHEKNQRIECMQCLLGSGISVSSMLAMRLGLGAGRRVQLMSPPPHGAYITGSPVHHRGVANIMPASLSHPPSI